MNKREHSQDPAEGPDDPAVYEPEPSQPNGDDVDETGDDDQADVSIDDIGKAMPGSGRLNESTENPGRSDPNLRPDGPAPLP